MLKAAAAAFAGMSALPLAPLSAADSKKKKVLYFTRSAGFEHSVVHRTGNQLSHSEKLLTEMGKKAGFDVDCTQDGTVFDGDLDQYAAIAFYTSGVLTSPQGNGKPMTEAGKQKLLDAVAAGKGFVGFHACTDSFHSKGDQIDPYLAMVGAEFLTHGQQQEASLILTSPRFPGVAGLGMAEGLSFTEEWYAQKNFAKDLHVILVQETKRMKDDCYQRPDFPCTWARLHGKGRVFYTSLGHREDIWTNPFFQAIVLGGFAWAMGDKQFDVKPNIEQVTPKANQLKN
jgi:type 1 glutamine amidotransferase